MISPVRQILLLWALVCFSTHVTAAPRVKVSVEELSELAGMTTEKVPEIQRARAIARARKAYLATYGGTSREVLDFIYEKIQTLGSVDAYRNWLGERSAVHLLDWHRISSDLDFLIVPMEASPSDDTLRDIGKLREEISAEFPTDVFHSGFDIKTRAGAFKDFDPRKEHFEAISNIPIGDKGVLTFPELDVQVRGENRNLARWGLEQYTDQILDFDVNPDYRKQGYESEAYNDLKQALRWIRYLSENPRMGVSARTHAAITNLIAKMLKENRPDIIRLLKAGDTEYTDEAKTGAAKIVLALEKIQLYSRNAVKTRALLDLFGITELANEAGIAKRRILEPLTFMDPAARAKAVHGKKPMGREIHLNHRTNLSAAQNVSHGAIWISNNQSIIRNAKTTAAIADGLYAAPGTASLSFGDMYVQIVLSADAVEGVDFKRSGDYYVLMTLDAIAKNPDGTLKIQRIDREALLKDQIGKLRQVSSGEEKDSLVRSLAILLSIEESPGDIPLFQDTLSRLDTREQKLEFLKAYFAKTGILAKIIKSKQPFAENIVKALLELRNHEGFDILLARGLLYSPETFANHPVLGHEISKVVAAIPKDNWRLDELLSDRRAMTNLREHFPAAWEEILQSAAKTHRLHVYPWDLSDPKDLAMLQKIDASLPADPGLVEEAARIEILRRYPGKYPGGKIYGRFIPDAELRNRYDTAVNQRGMQHDLEELFSRLAREDALGLSRVLPHHPSLPIKYLSQDSDDGRISASGNSQIENILEKYQKGIALTEAERELEQYYVERADPGYLTAMLAASEKTGLVALARLKRPDDAIYRLLGSYVGSTVSSEKALRAAFASDPHWKRTIRQSLEKALAHGGRAEVWQRFPWDLTDPQDVRLLRAASALDAAAIQREGEELRRRMAVEGTLPYPMGEHERTFLPETEQTDGSPWSERYRTIKHNYQLTELLPLLLDGLLRKNPNSALAKQLSAKHPLGQKEKAESEIAKRAWNLADVKDRAEITRLDSHIPKDAPEKLQQFEQHLRSLHPKFDGIEILSQYLDEPLRSEHEKLTRESRDRKALTALVQQRNESDLTGIMEKLTGNERAREEGLQKLLTHPELVGRVLSAPRTYTMGRTNDNNAGASLESDFYHHPERWHSVLDPLLEKSLAAPNGARASIWKALPWDLTRAADIHLISSASSLDKEQILAELQKVRREIAANGGPNFPYKEKKKDDGWGRSSDQETDTGLSLKPELVAEGPLRDRLENLLYKYELADRVLPDVRRRLMHDQPDPYAALFGKDKVATRRVSLDYNLLTHLNLSGYDKLDTKSQQNLDTYFEIPLYRSRVDTKDSMNHTSETLDHFAEALAEKGHARDYVINRLKNPVPGDDVPYLVSHLPEKAQRLTLKALRSDASFWPNYREALKASWQAGGPKAYASVESYPWDFSDAQDLALLAELRAMIPAELEERYLRLRGEILNQGPERFEHGWIDAAYIHGDQLRSDFSKVSSLRSLGYHLDRLAHRLAWEDPHSTLKAFPDLALGSLERYEHSGHGRSVKIIYHPVLKELRDALRNGSALSPEQNVLLEALIKHGDTGFIRELFIDNHGFADSIVEHFKATGKGGEVLMALLRVSRPTGDYYADSSLLEKLRSDPKLRQKLRTYLKNRVKNLKSWHDAERVGKSFANFPWSLKREKDRLVLEALGEQKSDFAAIRELRQIIEFEGGPSSEHGYATYFSDSEDIWRITNDEHRAQYQRLYMRAEIEGRVLRPLREKMKSSEGGDGLDSGKTKALNDACDRAAGHLMDGADLPPPL